MDAKKEDSPKPMRGVYVLLWPIRKSVAPEVGVWTSDGWLNTIDGAPSFYHGQTEADTWQFLPEPQGEPNE